MAEGAPWYKRFPEAALGGMLALTLEERGAYNTILDLIYRQGGPIQQTERWWSGQMNCDVRVWRRVLASLVAQGKVEVDPSTGHVSNARAELELTSLELLRNVRRTSGVAGGLASGQSRRTGTEKGNVVNGVGEATVQPNASILPNHTRARSDVRKGEGGGGVEANGSTVDRLDTARLTTLAEQIWIAAPPMARRKTGTIDKIRWALAGAQVAGHDPVEVADCLARYYAHPRRQEDDGKWAAAPAAAIMDDRWMQGREAPAASPTLAPGRERTPPAPRREPPPPPTSVAWEGVAYDRPDGATAHPIGTTTDPGPGRQLSWLECWPHNPTSWDHAWGPTPGSDGCRVWPSVLHFWTLRKGNGR